ncbi:cytochrome P450 [Amycolatopsis azurea]|uniref:Cytochrome n=1 Tax=Amycolatopsis azurea DSM 43854 TaxID=1238180 RepID=M2Q6K7_9PSEU|nr:cytochrome P450 [Amycolatopsis azurea]EMD27615.1 putative cytochrome P450 hydroxylase [Amycolatopsis azurea DSM 43854]OOC03023.1 cytochrome [Amycolatopsis azurea DSM 43854]
MLPDPFAATTRGITEPDPVRPALRAAGPLVEVAAPAGGSAWIVTEEELAREVLSDPRIAKDPALAPEDWTGLEQTAAEQPSLTTLDGPGHSELRRAHAPLLSAKRIQAQADRIHRIARALLTELGDGTVDLMDGFSTRFPLTVLLDLLSIPLHLLDTAVDACRRMSDPEPGAQGKAIAAIADLAAAGLAPNRQGLATELRDSLPPETSEKDLRYHLFALIFAGQLTTDASIGFLISRLLNGDTSRESALVRETLRLHPPAPFTLWRFTLEEIDLGGIRLPSGAPVLVDIQGINTDPARQPGPDLTFGAGPHFCVGAQLAQLELRAVATVLRTDFPKAKLAVPYADLRQTFLGGIQGTRLTSLPVLLHG